MLWLCKNVRNDLSIKIVPQIIVCKILWQMDVYKILKKT